MCDEKEGRMSVSYDGALIRAAVFGVSPKGLSFAFSDQLQSDTMKHFQTLCFYNYCLTVLPPSPHTHTVLTTTIIFIKIKHSITKEIKRERIVFLFLSRKKNSNKIIDIMKEKKIIL